MTQSRTPSVTLRANSDSPNRVIRRQQLQGKRTRLWSLPSRCVPKASIRISVDVRNLVDVRKTRRNPLLEAGVDLVNLDGRLSNAKNVSAIYDKGKDQYDKLVNDVIVNRNCPLDSPVKNNAFKLFTIIKRRKAQ